MAIESQLRCQSHTAIRSPQRMTSDVRFPTVLLRCPTAEMSGLAASSSSQPRLDVAQRAASGTFIAPVSGQATAVASGCRRRGSPRGVTFASETAAPCLVSTAP